MSVKVHVPRLLRPVHRIGFLPNNGFFSATCFPCFPRRHATAAETSLPPSPSPSFPLLLPHAPHTARYRPSTAVFSAVTAEQPPEPPVRMVAVVGHGAVSPLKSAPWEEVMLHTVK